MALTKIDDRGLKTPIDLLDNEKIRFGTGNDLEIYHDATHTYIKNNTNSLRLSVAGGSDEVQINKGAVDENMAKFVADGAVSLYYDNTLKFGTDSAGVFARGDLMLNYADNYKIKLGAGNDLQIYHDGTHNYIVSAGANGDNLIRSNYNKLQTPTGENCIETKLNGAVDIFYDNSKKLETISTGVQINGNCNVPTGDLQLNDNRYAKLGDGGDLQIWHDGTSNYISATGGASTNVRAKNLYFYVNANTSSEKAIMCYQNAATDLYYDDSKKLETTSSGVNVIGALTVDGAAIGGGAWEVIATHVLGSADNFSSTGWNTNYQNYKMVFTDVNNGSTGTNFGLQVYLDTSPTSTGTGTLETADNSYQYAFRIDTGTYGSNGEAEYHYLRGGASRSWWSGELTFPMHANTTSHKKTWYGHYGADEEYYSERCYMNNDPEKFIKGVRVYFDCGASGMGGRITFLRQKYS